MIAFTNSPPLATYILLAYRQADLVGKAIESALAQTYPNLEIIISDDCSPDDTWEVIQKTVEGYKGPHKIILNRTEHNGGLVGHINALFAMAHGEVFITAGGDDIAYPDRVARVMEVFREHPEASMVGSEYDTIDAQGNRGFPKNHRNTGCVVRYPYDSLEALYDTFPCFCGAVLAYRRDVFDRFGPLDPASWAEDITLGFRASLLGEIWWIESPLVHYRIQGGVSTSTVRCIAPVVRCAVGTLAIYRQLEADVRLLGRDERYAALLARISDDIVRYTNNVRALTAPWPWPSIPAGIAYYRHGNESRGMRRRALLMSLVPRFLRPGFFRLLRFRMARRA